MSTKRLTPLDMGGNKIGNAADGTAVTDLATLGQLALVMPSGDTSGVTDTAAINAIAQAGRIAVLKAGGTFYVGNLLPDSYGGIYGNGATVQAASGTTGYVLAWKTPATTKQVVIRDLVINCNQVCGGVLADNTGFTPATAFVPYDPLHSFENVFVQAAEGDAWHLDNNARGISFVNCRQYFASGYGFYLGPGADSDSAGATDCNFSGCISGQSGNHGFYVADGSSDNMFTTCKAFYCGFDEAAGTWGTTQNGFEVIGPWNTFSACNAQQAALHGFNLNGTTNTAVVGCNADTNGAGVTSGAVGININAAQYCSVVGNVGSVNTFDPPGTQQFGYQVAGDCTGTLCYGNSVQGTDGGFNYVSGFGSQVFDGSTVGMWGAAIAQVPGLTYSTYGTTQALSNGSTISNGIVDTGANFAVYPVSCTAAVTGIILEAPPNGDGTVITVVNTTGFPVTFAASGTSNVADGASDSIPALHARSYLYNGAASLWFPADAGGAAGTGGGTLTGYLAPAVATLTYGTTISVNAAAGNALNLTLTASTGTIANPTNPVDGQVIRFRIKQDGTGSRTVSWGTAYDFGTGSAPVLSTGANKVDIIAFEYVSSISKWACLNSGGLGY